jgi:hypothetical protein
VALACLPPRWPGLRQAGFRQVHWKVLCILFLLDASWLRPDNETIHKQSTILEQFMHIAAAAVDITLFLHILDGRT